MNLFHFSVHGMHTVDNRRRRGDNIQIEFPLQTLLNDFHVQKSQEAAAEAEAQGHGGFRIEYQGRVVDLELFQGVPHVGVGLPFSWVDPGVDHGHDFFVTRQGFLRQIGRVVNRVADPSFFYVFNARRNVADVAGRKFLQGNASVGIDAHFHHFEFFFRGPHFNAVPGLYFAVENPHVANHAPVAVVNGIEDQGL